MNSPLVLLIGAVAAALLAILLWSWRRLGRTSELGTAAPAATLRADTSSHVQSDQEDVRRSGGRSTPRDPACEESDEPEVATTTHNEEAVYLAPPGYTSSDDGSLQQAPAGAAPLSAEESGRTIVDAAAVSVPHSTLTEEAPHNAPTAHSALNADGSCSDTALPEPDITLFLPAQNIGGEPADHTNFLTAQTDLHVQEGGCDGDLAALDLPRDDQPAALTETESDADPPAVLPLVETPRQPEPAAARTRRPQQPAVHRDRRGRRRTLATSPAAAEETSSTPLSSNRPPAEAKLRLSLHPIRRTVTLSVVLTRPDGFPQRVAVQADRAHTVDAYDLQRYDDLDLPWTSELLDGELRIASAEGYQWLRSARQVHLFTEDPNEPELISVGAARLGQTHALVCRSADEQAVRAAAASAGSPDLQSHTHWQGIPRGWLVLSGYAPAHAASPPLPQGLRPLDPGEGLEIGFDGGLEIRPRVYASGHPPRIVIRPAPGAAAVTIGGEPATLSDDGSWTAAGWDAPGQHMIDIVPGPSISYEIVADPWAAGEWAFWNAHPERFVANALSPWARAEICGAVVRGPAGQTVFAAETQATLVALGAKWNATPLQRRDEISVSVGLMDEPPAFLIAASGQRRSQGQVLWLGLAPPPPPSKRFDAEWASAVRMAASRRLPLVRADAIGEDAWRKAKDRARRLWRRRS